MSVFKIYLVQNKVDGKVYIGRTHRAIKIRWKEHLQEASKNRMKYYFYNALRRHGADNLNIQEIAQTEEENKARELEKIYIILFRSSDPKYGYNSTLGGDGAGVPNALTRAKLSASRQGKNHPCWGRHLSKLQKERLRKAFLGRKTVALDIEK